MTKEYKLALEYKYKTEHFDREISEERSFEDDALCTEVEQKVISNEFARNLKSELAFSLGSDISSSIAFMRELNKLGEFSHEEIKELYEELGE